MVSARSWVSVWRQRVCRPSRGAWVAIVIGVAAACGSARSDAATVDFQDLKIEVVGEGRPMLMIPGLNSAASTWTDTCAALQPAVQCHIVQLPGFAGAPAVKTEAFIDGMRDRLLAYIDDRQLKRPDVMGHSLGGVLAMKLALKRPEGFAHVVVVDALPFLAALRAPGATAESAKPVAAAMREQMRSATPEQWRAGAQQSARGMTRDAARAERLAGWSLASDRETTAQAMAELWVDDLRPQLAQIQTPMLVLGAWAAYAPMGATQAGTRAIFEQQYAAAPQCRIVMSEAGYHFLMWDDADWLVREVKAFVAQP